MDSGFHEATQGGNKLGHNVILGKYHWNPAFYRTVCEGIMP